MDGKKVSDGVSKVVSRNQTNSAGVIHKTTILELFREQADKHQTR